MTFNDVTKDATFYTTTSHFVTWSGVFSQNVRDCDYPRMTSRILCAGPHTREMIGLESQEVDVPSRVLYLKPMS